MKRSTRGCGCAIAVLFVVLGASAFVFWKWGLPWWRSRPPKPAGELQVHVLDVGPIEGDSILIISPAGKAALIDTGDTGKGKVVLDALKRYKVERLDYFIATEPHSDHIGGADEVLTAMKVGTVIDNGIDLSTPAPEAAANPKGKGAKAKATPTPPPPKKGAVTAGNEINANSIVLRLDYGDFSMLFMGDAEAQTEQRLLGKDVQLQATVLKVAHHGSKYATSEEFVKRVKLEAAIISDGAWNRYGHPAQVVLDRLKAANAKVYRTDLQGEITITTKGKLDSAHFYEIKPAKETKEDIWAGREAQKDDSSRSGFITYGDFGPPPKPKKK